MRFLKLYYGQFKTPIIIVGSIVLLTALMLLVFDPPGTVRSTGETQVSEEQLQESAGEDAADISAQAENFKSKINQASSNEEFTALAGEITNIKSAQEIQTLMEMLFDRWVKVDIASALNFAKTSGGWLEYTLVAGGQINFPLVFEWMAGLSVSEEEKKGLISALYYGVGSKSPVFALTSIDLIADGNQKDQIMRALVEQWAARDLPSTLSWMNSRKLSEPMEELKQSLIERDMSQDSVMSGDMIRDMEAGQRKYQLARKYADQLAKTDSAAAASWARSLNDPEAYKVALSAVFEARFLQEPDKKKILDDLLTESDPGMRDHLINEVALDMASNDPENLARVFDQVPESARPDVADKIVRFWQVRNSDKTADWVKGLSSGPIRDRASGILVDYLVEERKAEQALTLVSGISDDKLRNDKMSKISFKIYQDDPSKAVQLIENVSFLSKEQKQSVLDSLQRQQK